jgi:hypothetical protein
MKKDRANENFKFSDLSKNDKLFAIFLKTYLEQLILPLKTKMKSEEFIETKEIGQPKNKQLENEQ